MIPEKYINDYKGYKALLDLGGENINQNLKLYREKLNDKYGKRFMESLWDRFIREYGSN